MSNRNDKDIADSKGRVKFSIVKKKGKHKRAKVSTHDKQIQSRNT